MEFTTANFEQEVLQFPGVVLVDYWATWCGPCRVMSPRVKELAEKLKDNSQVKIGELDVDANPEISEKYQVLSIPTFIVFINGELVDQRMGIITATELESLVTEAVTKLDK